MHSFKVFTREKEERERALASLDVKEKEKMRVKNSLTSKYRMWWMTLLSTFAATPSAP